VQRELIQSEQTIQDGELDGGKPIASHMGARMNHTRRKEESILLFHRRGTLPYLSIIGNGGGKDASVDEGHQRKHELYYQGND